MTDTPTLEVLNSSTQEQLKAFIQRIEKLMEEKKGIGEDIADVFAEAKGTGFDPKVMKELIKIRAKNPQEVEELSNLLDVYKHAVGMI